MEKSNSSGIEVSSANVLMRLSFTQPKPPAYLRGEERAKYIEERLWYEDDYVDYSARDGKYDEKAVPADYAVRGGYLDYSARQGMFQSKDKKVDAVNTGIFGRKGNIEGAEREALKRALKECRGNIWHGFVSPRREVGDRLLSDKAAAREFMQSCFDRFLKAARFKPEDVEWYAGWHDDSKSGIKHIQFSFFEKKPHLNARGEKSYRTRGVIPKAVLADTLEDFEEYFSGHRDEVHIVRDELRKAMSAVTPRAAGKELVKELIAFARELPKVKERAGYAREEYAPYRDRIDALTEKVIRTIPAVRDKYCDLMDSVTRREERFRRVAENMERMKPSEDKLGALREDIKIRMGNSVLALAKRFRSDEDKEIWAEVEHENYIRSREKERKKRYRVNVARKKNLQRIMRLFGDWQSGEALDVLDYYEDLEKGNVKDNSHRGDGLAQKS